MRNAATVLAIIRDRGRRGLPLDDLYRQLFNPDLFKAAYAKIYRNDGAMTPGVTSETADGMSLAKIERLIDLLKHERYRWTPVRRRYIEKKGSTTKRPLGIPTWSDKLLQEVIRMVLAAYYEPQFSDRSHGFRPGRGCHTALQSIERGWTGTVWFIEGDIADCFSTIDHQVLVGILAEKIGDNRFLRLIGHMLEAGYLEDWTYHATPSGTPQGGVASPILANLYLDRLDRFVETELIPAYTRGPWRKVNPAYGRCSSRLTTLAGRGRTEEERQLRKQLRALPSRLTHDPDYRRLRYVRYADDFLLGFVGTKAEAEEIKAKLGRFLRETLKLDLSETKTVVTNARTSAARFLGYELSVFHANDARTRGKRTINGKIALRIPRDVIEEHCRRYLQHGRPIQRAERLSNSAYSIVMQYQLEYRGVVQYYQMAHNLHLLNKLHWVMETSLLKTLANKHKATVRQMARRYRTTVQTPAGPRRAFQVVIPREGKKPLMAQWGGIPLHRQPGAVLDDRPPQVWNPTSELLERLLADTCELCGTTTQVEVHHIRKLADVTRPGRKEKPRWVKVMAARRRKTLMVCRTCHGDIHVGRFDGTRPTRT